MKKYQNTYEDLRRAREELDELTNKSKKNSSIQTHVAANDAQTNTAAS